MDKLKISDKKKKLLHQLGIYTIQDLLHYYPYRYDKNEYVAFSKWKEKQKVCFEGVLVSKVVNRYLPNRKTMQSAQVKLKEAIVEIVLFNQKWFTQYKINTAFTFFGTVGKMNKVVIQKYNQVPLQHQLGYEPQYSKKEGITNKDIAKYIQQALIVESPTVYVPEYYIQKHSFIDKQQAIENIHFPKNEKMLHESTKMLKYEEFLKFQLCVQHMNILKEKRHKKIKHLNDIQNIIQSLPFILSVDQQKAIQEIKKDLQSEQCMYRLLQGDVGSGKTIVAMLSMLCVKNQAALLAPTEILAQQHYENFKKLNENVVLLVGSMSLKQKKEILQKIENNEVQYIIGTHAIFQEKIQFFDLGLAIIDEQQRFGVKQRQALLTKGKEVDVLIMSATPIPRTLALVLYNDTTISTIKTLPKSKKKIHSYLIQENSVKPILNEIEEKINQNQQVYVVCPAIEKNDTQVRNIEEVYHSFQVVSKGKYKVGVLHGKMKAEEKNVIMQLFVNKEIQLLVTTTVIEVGVDVKSANVMIIYDAHRFGLSQLHQLRGRCARGSEEGYCYFLTDEKDELAIEKLNILTHSQDGFEIAEHDLRLRGPGDVLGLKQSGTPQYLLGSIETDQQLMCVSKQDAIEILVNIQNYPLLQTYIENSTKSYLD